ncbi:dipeptidase PepV [Clostridia bacterium]|nr:dipeptidase PepV [Clostridia bacterium]
MRYQAEFKKYIKQHEAEFLSDLVSLLKINSEKMPKQENMPYGKGNFLVLQEANKIAQRMGFITKNYDQRVLAVDFSEKKKGLDILAHLDVVPGGEGWTVTTPFEPKILEDKIYARGSIDDKGPAMAALYAMKMIKDLAIPLDLNVRLLLGTDEECGSSDVAYYYSLEEEAPATFSPDAEYPLINVEKGRLEVDFVAHWEEETQDRRILSIEGGIKSNVVPQKAEVVFIGIPEIILKEEIKQVESLTKAQFTYWQEEQFTHVLCTGKSAHASTPEQGNNAITALLLLLSVLPFRSSESFTKVRQLAKLFPHGDYYGKSLGIEMSEPIAKKLTMNFGILHLTSTGFFANFDSRTPVCSTKENTEDIVEEKFKQYDISIKKKHCSFAHHVPEDTPFIQTLLDCYEACTQEKGRCLSIGGGTYVHELQRGVAFGCMNLDIDYHLHGPDEFARLSDLWLSIEIFALAIVNLCSSI